MDVDWQPSPADVGAVIRARTRDTSGRELGTFNAHTRPTDAEVVELIDTATSDVSISVGSIPDGAQRYARRVAAIGAAMLVEISFFPDEINSTGASSPYEQLERWYEKAYAKLLAAVQREQSEEGEDVAGGTASPAYAFPGVAGRIGLGTRW